MKNAVNQRHDADWNNRVSDHDDFSRFKLIHNSISAARVWSYSSNCMELKNAFFIAKLISSTPKRHTQPCKLCNRIVHDIRIHARIDCTIKSPLLDIWWDLLIDLPLELYVELSECDDESLYCIMLEKQPATVLSELNSFQRLCYIHVVMATAA